MRLRPLVVFAACWTAGVPPLANAAQLVFDQPKVERILPIDTQEAAVVFRFKNTAPAAVRILELQTECDCVQASMSSHDIGSGKRGEIAVKFRSRRRNGTEVIRVKVVADNGEIHEISVTAKLCSHIDVSPLALHWMKGEKRETKEFVVRSTGPVRLRFSKLAAVKGSKVEMRRGEDGSSTRVQVAPPAGDHPFQDLLLLSVEVEGTGETKLYDLRVTGE